MDREKDRVDAAFETAWEERQELRPNVPVLRSDARFFFFAGAEAGAKEVRRIHEETYGRTT